MKLTFTTNKAVLAGCRQAGLVTKSDPPRMTKKGRLALLCRLVSEIQRADLAADLALRKTAPKPKNLVLEPKSKLIWRGGERYRETTLPFGDAQQRCVCGEPVNAMGRAADGSLHPGKCYRSRR